MTDSLMSLCDRHRAIGQREDELHALLGEAEAMLVDKHDWFNLTRVQRRSLPAAQAMRDFEDELEQLGRESAELVIRLHGISAVSLKEATAKLEVVARVIEPADYPDTYIVLSESIADLRALFGA